MKRQCTGANAEVPNFETTQAPPPSHDVPELPADVWRIVCTQLVQLLCDEADALEKPEDGSKRRKDGGWEVVHPHQVTSLALVNREAATVAWTGLYFLAGYAAFQQAAEAMFMARRSSHLRWTLKPPEILCQNIVLNALRTAYYAHMDMLKALKRAMIRAINGERRDEAKGLVVALRTLRDETSIVDRIYSIGSNYQQLCQGRVVGYNYKQGKRANDVRGEVVKVANN